MSVRFTARSPDGGAVTEGSVYVALSETTYPYTLGAPCFADPRETVCEFAAAPPPGDYDLRATYVQADHMPQMDTQVHARATTIQEPIYQFAEGATGPLTDTYLLIASPASVSVPAEIWFYPDGSVPFRIPLQLPPRTRVTLKLDEVPGLEDAVFAWEVRSPGGSPLAVERAVYFAMDDTGRPRAGHVVAGVVPVLTYPHHPAGFYHTRTSVLFTEGTNRGPFRTYLLLGNPGRAAVPVTLLFLREGLPFLEQSITIPTGRSTLDTATLPGLADESFAISVNADARIMTERAQYLRDEHGRLIGGLVGQGHTLTWDLDSRYTELTGDPNRRFFAEGATVGGFHTYVLLANRTGTVVVPSVSFHTAAGHVIVHTPALAPWERVSIDVAAVDPRLADTTFWFETDGPVGVERAMYWGRPGDASWTEGHLSSGTSGPRPSWLFAEGATGGAWGAHTYLLLANPGATDAVVTVSYLRGAGGPLDRVYVVPARQRLTVGVHDDPALAAAEFGMAITSTEPIVAERSLYWTLGEPSFVGGTCEVGQPHQ
jgi:hypothetical protein